MASHKPKSGADKGKETKEVVPAEPTPALFEPEFKDAKSLKQFRFLVGGGNEWGPTKIKPAGSPNEDVTVVPTFLYFRTAGLVTPFFDFFLAVLDHYRIHMLHLHPNVVLVLAVFAHLCEGFIGVRPSLELFRHFFVLRLNPGNQISGCVTLRLASKKAEANFILLKFYSHVKEGRRKWMLIDALWGSPLL